MATHAEVISVLKTHYGNQVAWISGKKPKIPFEFKWAVQFKLVSVDESTGSAKMCARILLAGLNKNRKGSDWISLDNLGELRQQISRTMMHYANLPTRTFEVNPNEALLKGREILKKLHAVVRVCTFAPNYLDVILPAQDYPINSTTGIVTNYQPELECLLKFEVWKGREPHRRKWRSKLNRDNLYNSGKYAWIVMMNMRADQACLYYANCLLHKSKSPWFDWYNLHKQLTIETARADKGSWRIDEVVLEDTQDYQNQMASLDPTDDHDKVLIDMLKKQAPQAPVDMTKATNFPTSTAEEFEAIYGTGNPAPEVVSLPPVQDDRQDPNTPTGGMDGMSFDPRSTH